MLDGLNCVAVLLGKDTNKTMLLYLIIKLQIL